MKDIVILVIGQNYWAKGETIKEAVANMKREGWTGRPSKFKAFIVHSKTYVDGMGYFVYPKDWEPKEIYSVGFTKEKKSYESEVPAKYNPKR